MVPGAILPPPVNQWNNPHTWGVGQSSGMPQGGNPLQQMQPGPQGNQSTQNQNQGTSQGAQNSGNGGTLNNLTGAIPQQQQQQQSVQGQVEGNRTNNVGNQQRKSKPVKNKSTFKSKENAPQEYADVVCYSCGEPGHHKTQCQQAPACFICKMVNHKVEDCRVRKKPRNAAKFVGSAATGLGFFQVDVGERSRKQKIPTYAPAQDHYGDCIHGLIFFVTDSYRSGK